MKSTQLASTRPAATLRSLACADALHDRSRVAVPAVQQVQVEPALDQRARQAQRIAAQRERILVAGRLEAGGEAAGQRVQALGDRQHLAQLRRRDRIAGEARHVGLVDRGGDFARGSPLAPSA